MQIFLLYGIIGFTWTFYRSTFHFPEAIDELIFKPLIFIVPVLYWVFIKEKRNFSSIGFSKKNFGKSLLVGGGLGFLFAIEGIATSVIKYKGIFFNPHNLTAMGFIQMGVISLSTGLSEEVLNRGFLMNRLWEKWGDDILANIVSSFLFMLLHLPMALLILNYRGWDIFTYELLILLLGFADGFIFARTRNIIAPTISHSLWNFSVVLFR